MLTGDKGKTAKMIGLQCGMFSQASPIKNHENTLVNTNMKLDATDSRFSPDKKISAEHDGNLYEITGDAEVEIKKILSFEGAKAKKLELLIDGGVFAKMLSLNKELKEKLNVALNRAAAVIIYRASPIQKE